MADESGGVERGRRPLALALMALTVGLGASAITHGIVAIITTRVALGREVHVGRLPLAVRIAAGYIALQSYLGLLMLVRTLLALRWKQ